MAEIKTERSESMNELMTILLPQILLTLQTGKIPDGLDQHATQFLQEILAAHNQTVEIQAKELATRATRRAKKRVAGAFLGIGEAVERKVEEIEL